MFHFPLDGNKERSLEARGIQLLLTSIAHQLFIPPAEAFLDNQSIVNDLNVVIEKRFTNISGSSDENSEEPAWVEVNHIFFVSADFLSVS